MTRNTKEVGKKRGPKPLKSRLVATRLPDKLDREFRAMCKSMKRKHSVQIRVLISRFTWGRDE